MATRDRKLLVTIPGLLAVPIWLLLAVAGAILALVSVTDGVSWAGLGVAAVLGLFLLIALNGFIVVQPNQAKVATFLGRYVEDYKAFVDIQAETAVRHVASVFPYDSYEEGQESLRGAAARVSATPLADLQERLEVAGIAVLDTRLRRLAYAPEITADMLRRQQADAIVAARQRIVEGAVGMVDHALSSLSERDIVDLDEERKAAMVSNLKVVLVSDRGAQPVVNSGSLYT
jgi:SPFH domain/Band 7 family protein